MIKKLHKQLPRFHYSNKILLIAAGLFIFAGAKANTWYVNDNSLTGDVFTAAIGDDTNPGTTAAPFATLQFAINAAAAGDTIYVDAGTYATGVDITVSKSGLVLRGAKFGVAAGPMPNPPGRSTDESIVQDPIRYGQSKDGIVVDGFTVEIGTNIRGIEARGLNSVIINNIVSGTINPLIQQAGISTRANAPNRTHSYLIAFNNVQNLRFGIYMDGNTENPSDILSNYVQGCFTAGFVMTASNGHHMRANVSVNNNTGLLCQKGGNLIAENTFAGNLVNGIRLAAGPQNFGNSIMNNFITGNATGINLTEDDPNAVNNAANYNFIVGNVQNIQNDHTASFNATCNWYGSTIPGLIAAQIGGNVLFNPFLADGTDTDPADGFQPVTTCIVTPIVLIDFTASARNYDVVLNWQTASEVNSSRFNIERSIDGQHFNPIGTVNAKGFSSVKTNYAFTDNKPVNFDKPTYYRIAMIDMDGTMKYTKIVPVTLKSNGSYVQLVYPNPVLIGKTLHADFISVDQQKINILFVSATGQSLQQYDFLVNKGANTINFPVPANATAGVNFLLIRSGDNVKQVAVYVR